MFVIGSGMEMEILCNPQFSFDAGTYERDLSHAYD